MSEIKDNETYDAMEHKDHILQVPDTYIGSIEPAVLEDIWVCENEKFTQKHITISPGFYNIFNEIVTNSLDQCPRTREYKKSDNTVQLTTSIKITIDIETGIISVYNDGDGIPVKKHDSKDIYIPELIFGQLLTSSNYDKTKKKTWGGKNGYGAKVTNIFSKYFEIETVDHRRGKKCKQIWRNNMSSPEQKAKITSCKTKPYTKITFIPDYERFEMKGITQEILSLLEKRIYDIAGCTPRDVSVYYNGKKVHVKDFPSYVEMYIGKQKDTKRVYEKANDSWEIVACASPDGSPKQVSIVNGICTMNGGKHVDYITNQICRELGKKINKSKTNGVSTNHIKNNLWVFINSLIVNPSFSSQTKEYLTTPVSKFGSKCELSKDFFTKLYKTEIVERARLLKSVHDKSGLTKTDGKKTKNVRGIPKLDDANWAGTAKSSKCTLIVTEGDSAKALVVSGLGVVGRDEYGVFPLRGKLLNIRDASDKQITGNAEIQNMKKILGLQQSTKSIQELRYGKVLILTDQDTDGSHIKGLLMNMFACQWSHLLEQGFLITMYTPIVKVRKGKKVIQTFYNQSDYEKWKETNSLQGLTIKYYKGLGTSTKQEAKEYFSNLHLIQYKWCQESEQSLTLAFDKQMANKRKSWLSHYDKKQVLNPLEKNISYKEFINKELIHFSNYDNNRSIPSFCDGNKPSQRKALYTFFAKNIVKELKVAQVTGYVTSETAYHHGESSMEGTIIGLAQDYVGSNNINLLRPEGMFGTRIQGGKDCAQSRYIFTNLEKIARSIYKKDDEPLLNFLYEEGKGIEPDWYVPIIPMILVNGSHGIGTGFSTHVPCYNPKDIITNIQCMMNNTLMKPLHPWYRKFRGSFVQKEIQGSMKWFTQGVWKVKNPTTIEITELPIGVWTDDYHQHIETLLIDNSEKDTKKKKKQCITDYKKCNDHDDENVHLLITFKRDTLSKLLENTDKLVSLLKLEESKSCSTSNLHVFDPLGEIVKFYNPNGMLRAYYRIRLPFYKKRKEYQTLFLQREIAYISEKIRFVQGIIDETIHISKKPNDEILRILRDSNTFLPDPSKKDIMLSPINEKVYSVALENEVRRYSTEDCKNSDEENEPEFDESHPNGQEPYMEDNVIVSSNTEQKEEVRDTKKILSEDYGYLLNMNIWSLTQEKVDELQKILEKKKKDVEYFIKITPKELWNIDLQELLSFL